jgi:hypothetical protein
MRWAGFVMMVGIGCSGDPGADTKDGDLQPEASTMLSGADAAQCDDSTVPPGSATLPCAVEAVISAKCRRCHDVEAVTDVCYAAGSCLRGPFPLSTWSDTRVVFGSKPVFERMLSAIESGFMPLQDPDLSPPVEALTAEDKQTLLGWLTACAPPATAADSCP